MVKKNKLKVKYQFNSLLKVDKRVLLKQQAIHPQVQQLRRYSCQCYVIELFVSMISRDEMFDGRTIVILDSGSDVSLLPQSLGVDVDGPAD